ncbi:DoxX family protein [Sphingobacterium athyrii]|nr:DoxX family protein [Sphingobacterium athyrii]
MTSMPDSSIKIWSPSKKFIFRFSFIFIFSFLFVFNNGAFPIFGYISKPLTDLMHWLTPWFAKTILRYHYDYTIFINGSGDTSYGWISLLLLLIIASAGTIIWSLFDAKRPNYETLYYWLTTAIRYYIALMLINYGVFKVMHLQMRPPSLVQLMQPLGEYTPMGLAWTFIGFSKGYNILIGIAEILSGLLLFRKMVVLGALVTIVTSINIMSINYFYDVPVKMVSTALFLLSLFLLLPFVQTLFSIFIKGRPAQLTTIQQPRFNKAWKRKGLVIVKILLLTVFGVQQVIGIFKTLEQMNAYYKKSPLYGIYHFEKNDENIKTIPKEWRQIIFQHDNDHAFVRDIDYNPQTLPISIDSQKHKLTLNSYQYDYAIDQNGNILLTKTVENSMEKIKLIKQDPKQLELKKHSFHWIQEYPNSR